MTLLFPPKKKQTNSTQISHVTNIMSSSPWGMSLAFTLNFSQGHNLNDIVTL